MAASNYSSSSAAATAPLTYPSPRSPPQYPDMTGKHRELVKVQKLEREIGFLEEELKSVENLQPASRSCKEVDSYVGANPDPLIPINRKINRSCRFWKWLCGKSCLNLSWICCCSCGCSFHCKTSSNCGLCPSCPSKSKNRWCSACFPDCSQPCCSGSCCRPSCCCDCSCLDKVSCSKCCCCIIPVKWCSDCCSCIRCPSCSCFKCSNPCRCSNCTNFCCNPCSCLF